MKQNIDICEFLSDCLIFFFILSPMSEGKTVSHLQIQDSGAKILYFTILKIMGFLKLERNDIDVSIIFRSNINDILSCHFLKGTKSKQTFP